MVVLTEEIKDLIKTELVYSHEFGRKQGMQTAAILVDGVVAKLRAEPDLDADTVHRVSLLMGGLADGIRAAAELELSAGNPYA